MYFTLFSSPSRKKHTHTRARNPIKSNKCLAKSRKTQSIHTVNQPLGLSQGANSNWTYFQVVQSCWHISEHGNAGEEFSSSPQLYKQQNCATQKAITVVSTGIEVLFQQHRTCATIFQSYIPLLTWEYEGLEKPDIYTRQSAFHLNSISCRLESIVLN